MKKITTYLLQLAAAMMLCSSMASCQLDDFLGDGEGTLPPGSHPISFVASVGKMKSRSQGKNSWEEDDEIGIRTINLKGRKYSMIGRYSLNEEGMMKDIMKRYTVGADESWKELDEEPLEWPYPKGIVSAWYPFDPQTDVAIDNQAEKGFDHLDFLSVITGEKGYKDVVDLELKHKMAKVTCRVLPGDGIQPDEFETLWLKLQGHTTCTFKETELTGGENIGWITPDSTYNYDEGSIYEALLVPNKMAEKDLISIGLKTNYDGEIIPKNFTYPSPEIEEGRHYIFTITVQKERIDVTVFSVAWEDAREDQHSPTKFIFRVNLTEDLARTITVLKSGRNEINTSLVELSDNVTPIFNEETGLYDKLDVEGNEFTINIGAGPETRSRNLVITKNEAVNNTRIVYKTGIGNFKCYVENKVFMIADETTLGYEDKLNVGDYFFSDGSWSSILGWEDVQCVGIVFAVNNGDDLSVFKMKDADGREYVADNAADYTNNPIKESNRIRGYVLALNDARRENTLYKKGSSYQRGVLGKDIKIAWAALDTVIKKGTTRNAGSVQRDVKVVWSALDAEFKAGTKYTADTLPRDTKVVWAAVDTVYKYGTSYEAGTLPRDIKVVKGESDTVVYKKGKTYKEGKLYNDIRVLADKCDTVYKAGTGYSAGTLPGDISVHANKEEIEYKAGKKFLAGTFVCDIRVHADASLTVCKSGTSYSAGTLLSDLTVFGEVESFPWSRSLTGGDGECLGAICSLDTDLFNGFTNVLSVKENIGKKLASGSVTVPPFDELDALAAAEDYKDYVKAPAGTSGWYLPSIKQLQTALEYIRTFETNLDDSPIIKANGGSPKDKYWSSTITYHHANQYIGGKAFNYSYKYGKVDTNITRHAVNYTVRAILTF